jgi:hypothetical protein
MLTYGVRFQFRGLVLDAPLGECPLRQGPVARSIASLPSDTRYRSHVHADAQDHRRAVEIIVAPATTATREYLQYRNIQPSREYVRQCFESMFITKGVSHAVAELGKACAFHLPRREAEIALKDELVYIQFLTSSIFVMSPLHLAATHGTRAPPLPRARPIARKLSRGPLKPYLESLVAKSQQGKTWDAIKEVDTSQPRSVGTCVRCPCARRERPPCCPAVT